MMPDTFPKPTWVDLRMTIVCEGKSFTKLVARFDPTRGLLQVVERRESKTFDLAQIVAEHQRGASQ